MGVGGNFVTLAARLRMFPQVVVTNGGWFSANQYLVWVTSLDTDVAWFYQVWEKSAHSVNFPYGWDVEEDFPM